MTLDLSEGGGAEVCLSPHGFFRLNFLCTYLLIKSAVLLASEKNSMVSDLSIGLTTSWSIVLPVKFFFTVFITEGLFWSAKNF